MKNSFMVLEVDQDRVLQWCEDNLPPYNGIHRFQWFPFHTLRAQPAFRLHIKQPEDAIIFALTWQEAEQV